MSLRSGWHFLQIPGPTNVPDRVLRALSTPTIDHRGPEFAKLTAEVLDNLAYLFKTSQPVLIFPCSGTGAWEAALVNTLSPGDRVLMVETGYFSSGWRNLAVNLGLKVEYIPGDWRHGIDPAAIERTLVSDANHSIHAVAVVHNETSSGVSSDVAAVRKAMDRAGHPALLLVDTISSLGCMDYRHDEWQVDVTVSSSQKGLMLPPGLGFNAVSAKAMTASKAARMPRSYWRWEEIVKFNQDGFFPYTPATNLLFGLKEALQMMRAEGLENIFARHKRHSEAARRAVEAWGLDLVCQDPAQYSSTVTAVMMPQNHSAEAFRKMVLERFNMSLGNGLGKFTDRVFRIGHLGYFNDLMLAATLSGVAMGLAFAGVPHSPEGVQPALEFLSKR
jgi:alanine-glyoxylate transaminase / serine-glyoxylate transaminase / serine-pyruvate transaminase